MNNIIKTTGLILFITGFGIFIATFFLASYQLSEVVVKSQIADKTKQDALINESSFLLNNEVTSAFSFVAKLNQTFKAINEEKLAQYSIIASEMDKMISSGGNNPFNLSSALTVFESNSIAAFKKEKFEKYGSWLDGRKYDSDNALRKDIAQIVQNIASYAIIQEKGFDKYAQKDLLYTLSKASSEGPVSHNSQLFLFLTYGLCIIGAFLYIMPESQKIPGIKNNHIYHRAMTNVGWLGILTGSFLIAFYVVLYFFPEYMTNWIIMVDPISQILKGQDAGRFFLYGFIYTLAILVMGARMILKYRHSKYHMIRTASVMFFQTAFAFLIPEILLRLNQPYFDFKNIWPLDYDFFFESELNTLIESGALGLFMLFWGLLLIIVAVPVFVYFFGKRWYCSWVCGCGGLAETLGDPYRQLSDKSLKAWKIERWMIHSVLVFAVLMTAAVLYTYFTGDSQLAGISTYDIRGAYGAWIGAGFAGVIGTGFYPLMGNRVWCRFGCPLAAYLGIVQKFKSRFRITTNGGQCISCGNCSTYCEMGIDVRWYAQRGQNIIRSSCVGCGVCSSVCPRGVLNLEVKDEDGRYNKPLLIGLDDVKVQD